MRPPCPLQPGPLQQRVLPPPPAPAPPPPPLPPITRAPPTPAPSPPSPSCAPEPPPRLQRRQPLRRAPLARRLPRHACARPGSHARGSVPHPHPPPRPEELRTRCGRSARPRPEPASGSCWPPRCVTAPVR
eukprot:scaffold2380_cov102-Isochrysis_galbana.AAC.3